MAHLHLAAVLQDPLECLPQELCLLILEYLDAPSLAMSCRVSRHWLSFSSIESLWKKLHLKEPWHVTTTDDGGMPHVDSCTSWKSTFAARHRLEKNWNAGKCVQSYVSVGFKISALRLYGERLFTGDTTGTILPWAVTSRSLCSLPLLSSERSAVRSLELDPLDPQAEILVAGHRSGALLAWHVPSVRVLQHRQGAHDKSIETIRFNERFIVTGSADHSIKIWARPSPLTATTTPASMVKQWTLPLTLTQTLTGHAAFISALSLTSDTLYSLSPGDCTIRTWSVVTGQCRSMSMCFGAVAHGHLDGQRICTGQKLHIYDAKAGRQTSVLQGAPRSITLAAHAVYHEGQLQRLVTVGSEGCAIWMKVEGEWVVQHRLVESEAGSKGGRVKKSVLRHCQVDERRVACTSGGRVIIWDFS